MNSDASNPDMLVDDCKLFDEFKNLDPIEKYEILNGISINLFAIACCRITSELYLFEVIEFMTDEQSCEFIHMLTKLRKTLPSSIFVKDTQNVIMDIFKRHKKHMSLVMSLSEYASINFATGLQNTKRRKLNHPLINNKSIH